MKESLIDIVQNISDEKKEERRERFPYTTVARLQGSFNREERTFWLCNSSMVLSMIRYEALNSFGRFVPKNANISVSMLNRNVGDVIEYDTRNNLKRICGLKGKQNLQNLNNLTSSSNKVDEFVQQSRRVCLTKSTSLSNKVDEFVL